MTSFNLRNLVAGLCFGLISGSAAIAEGRSYLGHGHLLTNDVFVGSLDRWRTGSFVASWAWGPKQDRPATGFGQVIEFRFNGELITPERISTVRPGDRPYVGALSFGLHTHFKPNTIDYSVGFDVTFLGPQTGLDDFQRDLHSLLGIDGPSQQVRNAQLGNDVVANLVVEAGHNVELGGTTLRPFIEGRAGVETLMRAGVDLTIGRFAQNALLARDPTTGHRYRIGRNEAPGISLILGADVAFVSDSEFLPASSGVRLRDTRTRARMGIHYQFENQSSLFYGVTWLGKEFEGQRDTQAIGSLRFDIRF